MSTTETERDDAPKGKAMDCRSRLAPGGSAQTRASSTEQAQPQSKLQSQPKPQPASQASPSPSPWPDSLCFIDVEASGFGRGSYPIEVGVAGPGSGLFCYLIRPLDSWRHWDPDAAALHGLSRDVLLKWGRPVEEVAGALNAQLAGLTVYSDAWGQDMAWISRLFAAADLTPRFRIESLRALLSEDDTEHWHGLKRTVERTVQSNRHRASTDARVLRLTYKALRAGRRASDAASSPAAG